MATHTLFRSEERLHTQFTPEQLDDFWRLSKRWKARHPQGAEDAWQHAMILEALSLLDEANPHYTFVAAALYEDQLYQQIAKQRGVPVESVHDVFGREANKLAAKGLYQPDVVSSYSQQELTEMSGWLDRSRNQLFTYIGLKTLVDRYVTRDFNRDIVELPQERWLMIAMTLHRQEKDNRLHKVKEAYWALSNLYMTVATPTLANAGKPNGQLSSCFIDTVDDSLQGIYDSNTDVATLSKYGGGIGVYMGKVRSRGSSIRGFKNASSGVVPWIKQLNNTAVSVDQLGQRQGAIAVYLDAWHKDILAFLDLRLNNGDERLRAHDIFTGICLPDLFMEKVEAREDWYLFDPHEVRTVMGFSLEDSYDEQVGKGTFRDRYQACVEHPTLSREVIPAIEIMKRVMKSQLETGVPFHFYRDEVNRQNPNAHAGMIYSSNLCTEIMQNMSATTFESTQIEDDVIITKRRPGDFVVCNLSSIHLARAVADDVLERLVPIQVRMLDNVIELNDLPIPQAKRTNFRYRGIGLGTFGWHHLLAKKGIRWESKEAVQLADTLYEQIAFLTIQASAELASERGSYPLFEGSDWQSGTYFEKRGYMDERWQKLQKQVAETGIRNGYLMAVAPNSSTAIIAGTTASIDPIFQKRYSEEKKDYKIPVTAPELNEETTWYYKSAYYIDQHWTIEQNAARQKHIDQSISLNFYVQNTIQAKELLALHIDAWKNKMKSTYYVRSTSIELIDCDSCSS
ncbi:ribonucleoside-diphosphate reductase subunit alpha [Chryseomicrobium palamuruense]|uniref:Ribonucleoside-diphosphate reductase n=1 Tax=Chryseomicrobium palamuruense TaxID=682973 RepID=A0ABV8UR92_9BACL